MSMSQGKPKTKDEFLNKAHEARQARELARRRNDAATTIQSHFKRFVTWRRLRKDSLKEQDKLHEALNSGHSHVFVKALRTILFFSQLPKDRDIIDRVLSLIYLSAKPKSGIPKIQNDKICNQDSEISMNLQPNHNAVELILKEASRDEESFNACLHMMMRLVGICSHLLDMDSNQSDFSRSKLYVSTINALTDREVDMASKMNGLELKAGQEAEISETYRRFTTELSRRTLSTRKAVFVSLSESISKMIKGPRTDAKAGLLDAFVRLSLNSNQSAEITQDSSTIKPDNEPTKFLIRFLSMPALIYYLENYSPDAIKTIKDSSILKSCLDLMSVHNQQMQSLSSTPALCLVANLVHLAFIDYTLVNDIYPFVITITKLLECCQKNMKQITSTNVTTKKASKKVNDSTDESHNHILGWLTRETAYTTDQETSKLIKTQLSYLWSVKFLKLLLNDLIKSNENHKSKKSTIQAVRPNKNLIGALQRRSSQTHEIDTKTTTCDTTSRSPSITTTTQNAPVSSFKRVVERAAYNVTKSIGYPYTKTTSSSSSSHSGCAKLLTEEARRISLVCFMLYTALKTLRIIKQDILTGLCFHDYVLRNLWDYIRSLGPQNGLRAFLDHLVINSKSSMPEFHILMLFCECASHIISILDDSELYEQQRPFTLEDLIDISAFLNTFVFRIVNNQLVSYKAQEMDPILQSTHKLLSDLYKRDCRRTFAPPDHWLIKELKISIYLKELDAGKPVAQAILNLLPHIIPHKERVLIFRKLVAKDRAPYSNCYSTFITIHRSRIVEDGYQQLARLPATALKGLIRVKFINDHGLDEAGIDQDGVFKEFLEDTIKRIFDPGLNLFSSTSEQRLYPSPTSRMHEDHLSLFNFVGKMLGKAVYEGIVVDVPFANFFLARVLGQHHSALYSPIDDLASLDPELYKNLIYIRHHDVSDLDLTFSIDQDMMGKIESFELEPGGKHISVTNQNRVRYIHSVANFRMKTQIEEQTEAFVRGFKSIVNLDWLHMFSASEFQRLISGDTAPIDLQDLRKHTKYFGGFHNNHRVVCWLWEILESDFTPEDHRLFLKFVTSCSKPPLLGFANLEPPFSIRCVEVSDDQDLGDTVGSVLRGFFAIRRSDPVDRLPTSSTCFNLLKLPNYQRRSTLREKLRYAIRSSPGFELS